MSDTPTPPTPDMQAAIEAAVNERLSALSGRMDRFEREAFSRTVKDGHIDKRIFGQGDSLRTHIGDGLAHTYRDQWLDREIMDLERLPSEAAAGFTIDAAMMTWGKATSAPSILAPCTIPLDHIETETDDSVLKCSANDKGIIAVKGGLCHIHGTIAFHLVAPADYNGTVSFATVYTAVNIGAYAYTCGFDVNLGSSNIRFITVIEVPVDWVGTVPDGAIITLSAGRVYNPDIGSHQGCDTASLLVIRLAE
jgi:hypothetical protein